MADTTYAWSDSNERLWRDYDDVTVNSESHNADTFGINVDVFKNGTSVKE